MRGLLAAVLALAGLQAITSSDAAANRFGGLVAFPGTVIRAILSPAVPGIPDLRPAMGVGHYQKPGTVAAPAPSVAPSVATVTPRLPVPLSA